MLIQNENLKWVKKQYPHAVKYVKVNGGYMVFAHMCEYTTWWNQK
jgi:hypothetical protein